jgi:thimet oligopeptidase
MHLSVPLAALLAAATLVPAPAGSAGPRTVPLVVNWNLSAAQIDASCSHEIARARAGVDALVRRRSARTFETVIAPLENLEADLGDDLAAQTSLYQLSPDAKVRDASQRCVVASGNVGNEIAARPDLYAAILAAAKSRTARTAADRKLTELYVVAGKRAGAGLGDAQRKTFLAREAEINDLETRFNANIANDKTTVAVTPAQLASLPAALIDGLAKDATGNTLVPVNESTYDAFMQNESDASARQAFYIAYQRRGGMANVKLLERALVARKQIAALLGFPNWATYVAADHMAGTPARIATFLSNLDAALLPTARAQRDELGALKGAPLDDWDVPYEQNQLRKSKYSVDQTAIRPYFPAQHTIDAVIGIYAQMLGLTFTKRTDVAAWAKDVYAYDVTDTASGAYRGRFYLDLFPRPGKYAHFANLGPTSRRVLPDGTIRPVVNIIAGNWPAPTPGKPSLLSHPDVLTFFHEFGHNVAALCADTPYETLNAGFRLDFVEAPSQMLENFVWDPTILKQISSNVDGGAPLPDDLIAKLIAARYFDEAYTTVRQVFYASVDQVYHVRTPPLDTTAVWKELYNALTPDHFVDGTYRQASFTHLMGGYEAGYYGYLWSKVYAQDMFTAFQAGGLENPAVGKRYRTDILAPARLEEPDDEVRAFLGRPMNPQAFYRELGIATPH